MALETLKLKLTGTVPLMMHNGRLADPTHPITIELKKLTSSRKKTEEDLLKIKKTEWLGGMVADMKCRPSLAADQVLAVVIGGARKSKDGKEAQVAVFPTEAWYPIEYDGPQGDLDKLYTDGRFTDYRSVVISGKRVMRSRPIFSAWSAVVTLMVETDVLDVEKVVIAATKGGQLTGIGEFRPRYGRFTVEVQ
jgi:hypothetical protein